MAGSSAPPARTPTRTVPPPGAAARPPAPPPRPTAPAATEPMPTSPPGPKPLPAWRRGFGAVFPWLAGVLLVCVVLQVFFAGLGVFTNQGFELHTTFVHLFEFVPILMIVTAAIGRQGMLAIWGSVALLVLIELQYMFVSLRPGTAAALHPVNAMAIFGLTLVLVMRKPFWTGIIQRRAPA